MEPSGGGVDGSRRLGGREDGGGEGGHRSEMTSVVVALSCSDSCALKPRGPPDAEEELDESCRYHKGAQRVVCGVRLV